MLELIIGYIIGSYIGPIIVIGLLLYGIYYFFANLPAIIGSVIDSLPAITAWLIHLGLWYINYVWEWLSTFNFISFQTIFVAISLVIIEKCVRKFVRFIIRTYTTIRDLVIRFKNSELFELIKQGKW